MPLAPYLGICPTCQSRVAVAAKICVSCGQKLLTGEAQRTAEERGLYSPDKLDLKSGVRGWFTNRRKAPRHDVQVAAQIQPHLLVGISLPDAQLRAGDSRQLLKLIGSTRNVSETGLAIVVPTLSIGSQLITEENCPLQIMLDIYPKDVIEMEAIAVRSEQLAEEDKDAGYLVGVCITNMNESDRARYLEYLGSFVPKTA